MAAGTLIYFDTNVFDPRDGLSDADESLLLRALASQQLRLPFDLDCFLEALMAIAGQTPDCRGRAERHLDRMIRWCDRRRFIGSSWSLLEDTILAYCGFPTPPNHFLDRGQLDPEVERNLAKWDPKCSPQNDFWRAIANDARDERERFRASFTTLLEQIGPRDGFRPGGTVPQFERFWEDHKLTVVQTLVEAFESPTRCRGLSDACKRRGLGGLLDVRCVRLCVVNTVGLMYSQFYNEGRQLAQVRKSDAADLRHTIAASAAEIFVSNDRKLCNRLNSVPMNDGFKVLGIDELRNELDKFRP